MSVDVELLDVAGELELRDVGRAFAIACLVQTPTRERMLDELERYVPAPLPADAQAVVDDLLERELLTPSTPAPRPRGILSGLEGQPDPRGGAP